MANVNLGKPPVKPKPKPGQTDPPQGANDTAKPIPGKPGSMPPSIDPAQRSPSQTGFDYERWKASRPQTRVIMPGQGQGPMPIGTRPLPPPVVKDTRGELGGGLMGGGQNGQPDWAELSQMRMNPGAIEALKGQAGFGGGMMGYAPPNPMPPQGGMGRDGQYNPNRDYKGPSGQGGQQIPPGPGSPMTYGGPKPQVANPYTSERVYSGPQGGVTSGGKPFQGAPPPQDPGMGGQRPPRPPQGRPPVNPQQMQQGAQELYNDNTIPHEFKGQLMQAAQSGDPQAFNEMLFNSGLPQETKMRLQQMFGYGGGGGAPTQSAQPDQGQQQVQGQDPYNSQGSPYYGAF